MAEAVAGRPGTPVRRVCRHQRNHCCGGCPAEHWGAGVEISALRGHPGYPGRRGRTDMARHHGARFPLPAGSLGDHYRRPGACRTALIPHELWARSADGACWPGLDRLRHYYRRPTCNRAARRGLVDRCLRDCVWGHVRRGVLRITLTGLEPGLNIIRSARVPLVIYSTGGWITSGGAQFSRRRTDGTRRGKGLAVISDERMVLNVSKYY